MIFDKRVMRVMTHINAGATFGLVAWTLSSWWDAHTGHLTPAYRDAEGRAHVAPDLANHLASTQVKPSALAYALWRVEAARIAWITAPLPHSRGPPVASG